MSDSTPQKYPKVGVFLIAISPEGKWLFAEGPHGASLPFRELLGGETWESAARILVEDLKLIPKEFGLAGIGAGKGLANESLVYCAFRAQVEEESRSACFWQKPEKVNELNLLSSDLKKLFKFSWPQIWID